eukprot:scaffold180235_cov34-Attheya_sp.AAC.2
MALCQEGKARHDAHGIDTQQCPHGHFTGQRGARHALGQDALSFQRCRCCCCCITSRPPPSFGRHD